MILFASVGDPQKGAKNRPRDVRKVKRKFVALGYNWIEINERIDNQTIAAIRLFQAIINQHTKVSGDGVDGRIDVNGKTHKWLQSDDAPRWMLMPLGSADQGYINYERQDTHDKHDYGTHWMSDTIAAAALSYRDKYLAANPGKALLTINDVSLPRGGKTPDHKSHQTGMSCDIKLPRVNGKAGWVTHFNRYYDREAMRAMLVAINEQPLVSRILFNDPVLVAEGLCRSARKHDNHAHYDIIPPQRAS